MLGQIVTFQNVGLRYSGVIGIFIAITSHMVSIKIARILEDH